MVKIFRRRACANVQRLTQDTFLAMLPADSKQKEFYSGMAKSEWEVLSFDPQKREACVKLLNKRGADVTTTVNFDTIIPSS